MKTLTTYSNFIKRQFETKNFTQQIWKILDIENRYLEQQIIIKWHYYLILFILANNDMYPMESNDSISLSL